ncbi:MAG: AbrB/MazE/SpoVT family DNA-binding domain-containing protein [Blastocatellia bacterium]
MKVQIQKWGNSLALRIPKSFAVETRIEEGSTVDMTLAKNGILMSPAEKEITLEILLAGVTTENIHSEIDFGKPKGREIW